MNIEQILKFLPHRYPFLLVDKVIDYQLNDYLVAIKNVTVNEPFFPGHFPGRPVMPGVLMIEAMAQAAGILAYKSAGYDPKEHLFYLASIDNVRFKQMVVPGDQLTLKITFTGRKRNFWKIHGEATVEGKTACVADILCAAQKEETK